MNNSAVLPTQATAPNREQYLKDLFGFKPVRGNYLSNISERFGYLYVETPKVACSTIKRTLQLLEVDGDEQQLHEDPHERQASPLKTPLAHAGDLDEVFHGDFFRFCFVRNPYSRILSSYLDKIVVNKWEMQRHRPNLGLPAEGDVSFEEFLEAINEKPAVELDIHYCPQVILLQPDRIKYDFIGRFDSFAASFDTVLSYINPTENEEQNIVSVAHHSVKARQKLAEHMTPRVVELIQSMYHDDFEAFGISRRWRLCVA